MWTYKRMLKIPWKNRVTYETQKTGILEQIMRGGKYKLLQLILSGKIKRKRGNGGFNSRNLSLHLFRSYRSGSACFLKTILFIIRPRTFIYVMTYSIFFKKLRSQVFHLAFTVLVVTKTK